MRIKSNKVLRHSIKTIDGADNTPNTDSDFIGDLYKDTFNNYLNTRFLGK